VKKHCEEELGLLLPGRFGEFVYINMDAVIERSMLKYKAISASLEA
jgi:UDP-galactopyranose mutase